MLPPMNCAWRSLHQLALPRAPAPQTQPAGHVKAEAGEPAKSKTNKARSSCRADRTGENV